MVYCAVTMIIREGRMDDFISECRKIRPVVIKEKGCRVYDYITEFVSGMTRQEPVNPNRITLFEMWETLEDINHHSATIHMSEFVEKVKDMRESVVIRVGQEAF